MLGFVPQPNLRKSSIYVQINSGGEAQQNEKTNYHSIKIRNSVAIKPVLGYRPQVPDDAQPGHKNQKIVGNVYFPPEESLAGGDCVVMMIVVPAFPQCNHGQNSIVAAGVRRLVTAASDHVIK